MTTLLKSAVLFVAALFAFNCSAESRHTSDVRVLPAQAQEVLDYYFEGRSVRDIEMDIKNGAVHDYEVTLSDGTEVKFASHGGLRSVDCPKSGQVPAGIVLKPIIKYVYEKYPYDVKIHEYELDSKDKKIEVTLNNGKHLEFALNGSFLREER